MQPTYEIFNQLALGLSSDTTTLANATALKVLLSKAPFTPSQNSLPGDIVEANFDGYAPISPTTGTQNVAIDPFTNERLVEMKTPAGGWRWSVTGLTNLPQTIYGFQLVKNDKSVVYGSALFPEPILLDNNAQVVEIDSIRFRFLFSGIQ